MLAEGHMMSKIGVYVHVYFPSYADLFCSVVAFLGTVSASFLMIQSHTLLGGQKR